MNERREFAAALRHQRERRGITLDEVAEQTKINVALLAGLERAELSRWPTGIFRRAFVRSYASAVGLDPDTIVASFCRLFPESEDGRVVVPAFDRAAPAHDSLRLTLASHPRPSMRILGLRAVAVVIDGVFVASCGAVAAAIGVAPFSVAALAVGLVYFASGTLVLEASPGWWVARRWIHARAAVPEIEVVASAEPSADELPEVGPRRMEQPIRAGRRDRRGGRPDRQRSARGVRRPS
jgi:transcriptional regulator with XRE-family HTH domain